MRKAKPGTARTPGAEPAPAPQDTQPGVSDPDAAVAAAQAGRARKISKPKPAVGPSKVKGDPERPKEAPVNAGREMGYEAAMKLRSEGKLKRSVLTEKGWVFPPPAKKPKSE